MNSIVTLKRLVELLSQASGKNMAYVDAYIRAFTDVVRSSVASGEFVKVKGLGTFALDPDSHIILFEPDAELAQAVNEPFAMFPAEEVANTVEDEIADPDFVFDISLPDSTQLPASASSPVQDQIAESAPVAAPEPEILPMPEPAEAPEIVNVPEQAFSPEPASDIDAESGPQPVVVSDNAATPEISASSESLDTVNSYPEYTYDLEEEEEKRSFPVFWVVWSVLIGAIVGLLIGFLLHDPIMGLFEPSLKDEPFELAEIDNPSEPVIAPEPVTEDAEQTIATENVETPTPVPTETPIAEVQPTEVVYDHVTTNISDLALKHYGNKNYWVYIYLENKSKISNPNKIAGNVQLVIPPREKYEVGNTEAEKAENAKQKANEILKSIK